ncbi:DUF4386 family protein [Sphingobacterium sp. Ag1]|uniref:DUF4386 family protein n=1 Tax=Sphingobacterium sp. Ag1 TaxID=1643451 RepID=UPI0012E0C35F
MLPFGYLVHKSDFLRKVLGILLMLGCFVYLINFCGNTLSLNYGTFGIGQYMELLPAIGEIGIRVCALFVGAKNKI